MNRTDFLKRTGLAGLASLLPLSRAQATAKAFGRAAAEGTLEVAAPTSCVLIPSEMAGPYPLNLSTNQTYFRQDIRENQVGPQLDVTLKIGGGGNCGVMRNARVDLWHCNRDGYYSGYTTNGQQGQQNNTTARWLRGIQLTDADGLVRFTTIFPGWYSGRVSHVHFQVYLSSLLSVTSQFTFPVAVKNQIYTTDPLYAQYGADPASLQTDMVFADGYNNQMATLTPNAMTDGWDAYLEVGINASGVLGLLNAAPETGGQFTLGQNYPNPCAGTASVPFGLVTAADVALDLYDLTGRRVAILKRPNLAAGEHTIGLDFAALGLPVADYAYQLTVTTARGTYHQCKRLTAVR